jgi:ElaB/YqjD/DUF883 family membrane-anchored ribosome-binding protein
MGQATDPLSGRGQASDAVDDELPAPPLSSTGTMGLSSAMDAGGDTGAAADASDDTVIIEYEIEQTRADMSETIDAIQQQLSPDHLKEQAREMVRDATIGKAQDMVSNAGESAKATGSSMVEMIKQNPVPAALAGIGLGWLWMKRPKQDNRAIYGGYPQAYPYPYPQQYTPAYGAPQQYSPYGASQQRDSKLGQAADAVGETASNLASSASSVASSAADQVGNLASGAAHLVGDTAQQVGHAPGAMGSQAQQLKTNYVQMVRERPMAGGLVALSLGAAVGMLLPETQPEQRLMGEARDSVAEKAQSMAQQAMGRVQDVVETVQDEMQSSTQSA